MENKYYIELFKKIRESPGWRNKLIWLILDTIKKIMDILDKKLYDIIEKNEIKNNKGKKM